MIKDLQSIDVSQVNLRVDVCIVGAGTAGIFLGQRLNELGLRVILLECGEKTIRKPSQSDEDCLQVGVPFKGAQLGRGFGLGGTSALWGGQMISLSPSDIEERTSLSLDSWPITYAELIPHFQKVKRKFLLDTNSDELETNQRYFPGLSQFGENFHLRVSEWLPFRIRNFSQAFSKELNNDPLLEVWLNSTVTQLKVGDGGGEQYIQYVEAKSPNNKSLRIESRFVVICAGTLESTRLLLSLDESTNSFITRLGSPIGRYFADHLSVTCGKFKCHDWKLLNSQIAPIFSSSLMRSPRLELTSAAQEKHSTTSAFVHFPFVTQGDTGLDLVRNFLRKRQGELTLSDLSSISFKKLVCDLYSLALWRGIHNRLWIPRQADLLLQVDIEQLPNWSSRLYLSGEKDCLGRKKLVIDWRISRDDIRVFDIVAKAMKDAWDASLLRDTAELELALPSNLNRLDSLYDVYHPTGSLRMGTSPRNSVVDSNLQLWALENCFVSSTAVFPTAGSANPGLTHLALTSRLAEYIHQRCSA